MKMLFYCTKTKPQMYRVWNGVYELATDCQKQSHCDFYGSLNGKIVGECDFKVEEIYLNNNVIMGTKTLNSYDLVVKSKVEIDQMRDYFKGKNGYAIHIKNLKIYDEPRELSDFGLKKAPQNMCYGYEEIEHKVDIKMYDRFHRVIMQPTTLLEHNKCVVISIRPQWMCLIANRIKDVEVRRKVLKGMLL